MGRKTEYTDQQIIDTGLGIEEQGDSVNPFAIRTKLGGGSSPRIKSVWEKYNKQRIIKAEREDELIELPPELSENIAKNVNHLIETYRKLVTDNYKIAQLLAEKSVKIRIDEFDKMTADFEEAEKQAADLIEKGDNKIEALEDELENERRINIDKLTENSKQTGIIEALQAQVISLEARVANYNGLQRTNGVLEERLRQAEINR